MEQKQTYRILELGKKAKRRDYSKVSGELALPDLVEIQTASFDWFKREGIQEVFDDIYPISNYGGNIQLRFTGYDFGEPKYNINECKYRETNYAAPLKGQMELEMIDPETGEVLTKNEEVFLGEFPLMTETGTFIINGAERVIVSQIVRSPGAYFDIVSEDKTGRDTFQCELIPSRGTWLEFMSDSKKVALGRIMNMSVDRKRKILSTILFKAIGLSLDIQNGEDAFDTTEIKKFLKSMGLEVFDDVVVDGEPREFLNLYMLLYTSIFGNYEEIKNTLAADKVKTTHESLINIYENQRSDEVPTLDGSITLMNAKFFDHRRYDLTKAGRYKLNKKLNVLDRIEGAILKQDIVSAEGKVLFKKGTTITKAERNALKEEIIKGNHMMAMPFNHKFSHPDTVVIPTSWTYGLIGRILATDVEGNKVNLEKGTVLTEADVKNLASEFNEVTIYNGIIAQPVKLSKDNIKSVLNYGQRFYVLGRLTENDSDVQDDMGLMVERYIADEDVLQLTTENSEVLTTLVNDKHEITAWLVGSAVQTILVAEQTSPEHAVKVIGNDPFNQKKTITISDMIAFYSYELNMLDSIGSVDDIDQLGNRRIRTVGELIQNQFRIGLSRMERVVKERMSIAEITGLTP
ncbi:MAG: DNA-directed RNA polymerase subunit beta, partial [Anaerorhabdus sp.]